MAFAVKLITRAYQVVNVNLLTSVQPTIQLIVVSIAALAIPCAIMGLAMLSVTLAFAQLGFRLIVRMVFVVKPAKLAAPLHQVNVTSSPHLVELALLNFLTTAGLDSVVEIMKSVISKIMSQHAFQHLTQLVARLGSLLTVGMAFVALLEKFVLNPIRARKRLCFLFRR